MHSADQKDPLERNRFLLPAIFFGLALFYTLPFLLSLSNWGIHDWDRSFVMAGIPGDAIFRYGQFPFWNPYMGGGNIFFHHPEVLVLSPFVLLYFIFGAVVGLKLQILFCYFIGFWGSYRFSRLMNLSPLSSLVASIAYFGSVYYALHFAEGHVVFGEFCLLPWFLVCVLEAAKHRTRLFWGMLLIALMILGNGGGATFLYTVLFSGCFALLYSFHTKSPLPIINAVFGVLGGMLLSAVKFVPMMAHLLTSTREGGIYEGYVPLAGLFKIFFGLQQSLDARLFPEQVWGWPEYGAYISPLLLLLALIAAVIFFRRVWFWIVLFVLFLLLGIGDFGTFSPWHILTQMPGYHYSRCAGRGFQFVILSAAILGGLGFDFLLRKFNERGNALLSKALLILPGVIVVTNMALAWPIMTSAFPYSPKPTVHSPVFQNVVNDTTDVYRNFLENRGSLLAYVTLYSRFRALVDFRDTTIVSDAILSGTAEVTKREITPNRLTYEIDAKTPGQIAVSAGYDVGWQTDEERGLEYFQDIMKFSFNPGKQTVVLSYRPPWFFTGLFLTLISVFAWLMILRKAS